MESLQIVASIHLHGHGALGEHVHVGVSLLDKSKVDGIEGIRES